MSEDAPYVVLQIEKDAVVEAPVVGRLSYDGAQAIVVFPRDRPGSLPGSVAISDEKLRLWRRFTPGRPAVYLYDEILVLPG